MYSGKYSFQWDWGYSEGVNSSVKTLNLLYVCFDLWKNVFRINDLIVANGSKVIAV